HRNGRGLPLCIKADFAGRCTSQIAICRKSRIREEVPSTRFEALATEKALDSPGTAVPEPRGIHLQGGHRYRGLRTRVCHLRCTWLPKKISSANPNPPVTRRY